MEEENQDLLEQNQKYTEVQIRCNNDIKQLQKEKEQMHYEITTMNDTIKNFKKENQELKLQLEEITKSYMETIEEKKEAFCHDCYRFNIIETKNEGLKNVLKETENSLRCANLKIMELEKEIEIMQDSIDEEFIPDHDIPLENDPTDLD